MSALPQDVQAVYPWTGHYLPVDGGRMHFVDEGDKSAPVLLCLHGNPTWSFYWRALIARFSENYRVIAPDHIGCGLSDKPQHWSYRLDDHIRNISTLIDALNLRDITFVLHDWGGAIGMGVATRRPKLASRFVVTNTAAFLSKDIPPSIASVRIPGFGTLAVLGANAFARAATIRAVKKPLSRAAKRGLLFPYSSWQNRIATLRFVQDIPLSPDHPSYEVLAMIDRGLTELRDRPMLLCWGEDDFCFTPKFRAEWQRRFPDAEVLPLDNVGHYVMEDAPDELLGAMQRFL